MKWRALSALLVFVAGLVQVDGDVNGGTTCAGCAIIVGLVEQLAQVHATDVVTAAEERLCPILPSPFDKACDVLVDRFGPALIDSVYHDETPDMFCHQIGLCYQQPGTDYCHVFPLPPNFSGKFERRNVRPIFTPKDVADNAICQLPGISEVCKLISKVADDHIPLQDKDKDKFSLEPTLRGFHWRGKDCDDGRNDTYPGRKPLNMDRERDSNCNGIYGVNPNNGVPYEQMYCSESSPRGIVILGDSAAAHFHIPPEYFMAETLSEDTFQDLIMILSDEFDWPQLSSITAYTQNQWPHSISGPVDSMYMKLLKNNKCIHRDYQNIGVNGGDSGNMHDIMKSLARNKTTDYPLFIMLALVGNDVCNGHNDTVAHMTTVAEYRSNMMTTLRYLDQNIPKGSTVAISGLADGRVLWNTMAERLHPMGVLNSDVRYKDLYAYLNCLEVSPCTGWMSSNETLRNITSERAANLSAVAKDITEKETFNSFECIYIDFDIQGVIDKWVASGGEAFEVIEPVDGFHPSQVGQALTAQEIFDTLMKTSPASLGKVNPNNNKISTQFGDQGGY